MAYSTGTVVTIFSALMADVSGPQAGTNSESDGTPRGPGEGGLPIIHGFPTHG